MSPTPQEFAKYLEPTFYVDSDAQTVKKFAAEATKDCKSEKEKAVALFYAVRDGIRYNPYQNPERPEDFKASAAIGRKDGFCVPKAITLAAAARAVGIPARLGFADVKNHLTTKRLQERMNTDVFVYHGYAELYLGGKWVKATPTFNRSLCEKFGVKTLEFDGEHDSLFHSFDRAGNQHMEYVRDHGTYADLPFDQMMEAWQQAYGHGLWGEEAAKGDFEKEAEAEKKAAG